MSTQTKRPSRKSIALRAVVSGLLASPLSDIELKKFAQDLDLEFLSTLREMLFSLQLPSGDFSEDVPPTLDADNSLVKMIADRAKSRRLSKSQIYEIMLDINNSLAKSVIRPVDTMRETISRFVENSGPETANRLLSRVLGEVEQDPYLAGISQRK